VTSPPDLLSPAFGGIFNMEWRGGNKGEFLEADASFFCSVRSFS